LPGDAAPVSHEGHVLALVRALVRELHPQRTKFLDVALSSRLDRDLGIDSLGRTELILRLERAFRVRLPASVMEEADTVGDLLDAILRAHPDAGSADIGPQVTSSLPLVPAATEARTLTEMLDWHVAQHADRLHVTLLQDEVTTLGTMSYGALARAARAVAAGLIAHDIAPGDRVALMLPTSLDFFAAFFGALYAGAVPVPIYPPARLSQIEEHLRRQAVILRNAGAGLLVMVPEARRMAVLLRGQVDTLRAIESVADLTMRSGEVSLPAVNDRDAVALIQYTSGSTGDPKGVVLSHANLLANIRAMGRAMEASSADIFVSWLPLYHDMGLIGAWLGCLYFAAPLYVMSPVSFLVRPESWLRAIHRFRATLSAGPNFGFELCLNKVEDADLKGLDLGSLRMVANGAEPVSVQTLRRFAERFGRYGFRPNAMAPVYGLAENAVGLAFPPPGRGPVIDRVSREALARRGAAELAAPDNARLLEIVACGQPLPDHEIRIVDVIGREVGERQEGRIEFRGPSATSGYFRNETKTHELLRDGWLDTGDRGYIAGGDLFITGRIKDIVIRGGRNVHPQEVEEAVGDIPGIRKGGVAVFGVPDATLGTERLIVLAEAREIDAAAREELRARAQDVATDILGEPPDEIVLVAPRTVPKTSSGKIRRSAAKELYRSGRLTVAPVAPWRQMLRLWLSGAGPRAARAARLAGDVLYAGWWWVTVALAFVLGWVAVMVLPRLDWRWAALRRLARAAFKILGVPISASGIERVPRRHGMLAVNHSSYMDAVVLCAVLPGEPVFIAKQEFATQVFAGPFMRRLDVQFVERYVTAGRAEASALAALARQGRVLVFFPEGTFTRRAGLSAFYLGAFTVASEAGVPVVPGIIRGTRSMLRGDQWFPRWTPISVEVAEAVQPGGTDFASVLQCWNAVRAAILARCGEPDLGELVRASADSA
jgi:acyl carrier protein